MLCFMKSLQTHRHWKPEPFWYYSSRAMVGFVICRINPNAAMFTVCVSSILSHVVFSDLDPRWRPPLAGRCCHCTCACFASPDRGRHRVGLQVTQRVRESTYFRRLALCSGKTSRFERHYLFTAMNLQWFYDCVLYSSSLLCTCFQLTDQESIKKCIEECEARIEIGETCVFLLD